MTQSANPTSTPSWLTPVELVVLGAIWGASFLFMRIAAHDFGSIALVEVRLLLGAVILLPWLWRERQRFTASQWYRLAGIAAINTAIPFSLFAWAAQRAPAGVGAITNAMAVPFTATVAYLIYGERVDWRRACGLLLGFIGVAVLAGDKTSGTAIWPAALAGTFAALLYGLGINLIRHHVVGIPPGAVAAASLLLASALLAPFAVATWPALPIPTRSWISAALLGVLCTGIASLGYYRLIYRIGALRASTVTYLIPLFAVLWAWVFLREPLSVSMAVAGGLILGGVALGQQRSG